MKYKNYVREEALCFTDESLTEKGVKEFAQGLIKPNYILCMFLEPTLTSFMTSGVQEYIAHNKSLSSTKVVIILDS